MLENPWKLLARLPGPVRLLITGTLINKAGTFIVPYLTIVLFREFRLAETQVAELLSAYGAGSIVSILAGGFLTDRLGRRRTLMVSLFGSGVLAVGLGFAPSTRVFVPLLVVFGFVADLYRPAASAIIGDLLPSTHRVSGFAALRMAVNLGFAVGMAVGGLLADWNWRLLFLGDGLTTLLYGLVVYFFIPETRPDAQEGPAVPGLPPPSESPFRDGIYLQITAVGFAFSLVFFSHISVMPLTITGAGYPALAYGLLVGLNGLLIALWVMSVLTWTAGEILASPQQMAFIADWAPPSARGRYLSLYQATWSLAFAINPILFLPVHATLGEPRFWGLMFLIALPGAAVLVRLDRIADRPDRLRGLSLPPADPELLRAIAPEG